MYCWKNIAQRILAFIFVSSSIFAVAPQEKTEIQAASALDARTMTVALSVSDRQHRPVRTLKAEDLVVLENNQPQQITSFGTSDAPACIGLVVDSSGSMRHKRPAVVHALMEMVRAGNSEDRIFVVNFNDQAFIDQELTRDRTLIQDGLERAEPRGGTALYDAVIASADHLRNTLQCGKRVLVVVTDGEDNSSRKSLQQAIDANRDIRSAVIYGIGMPNEPAPSHRSADRRAMDQLTASTGGTLFYTGNLKDLDKVALKVADEIQGLYLVSFSRTNPLLDGSYRKIKIELQSPGYRDVTIRTRDGYYARTLSGANSTAAAVSVDKSRDGLGCVTGVVTDENRQPVSGITVRLRSLTSRTGIPAVARSDDMGKFRVASVEAGPYEISTENRREGYPPTALSLYRTGKLPDISVNQGTSCADVAISTGPRAGRLRLNIVDTGTHQKLGRFTVTLQKVNDLSSTLTLPTNGDYSVLIPALTDLNVQVQAPGYKKSDLIVLKAAAPDAVQELTIQLEPDGDLHQKTSQQ